MKGKIMKSNQRNEQLVAKFLPRAFCMLFIVVVLSVFCSCHNRSDENKDTEKKEITSFKLSDVGLGGYYNIDYFEDKIYALQEEGIYIINPQDCSTEKIVRVDKEYCYSKIYDNFIYLADQTTGEVLQFEFNGETIGDLSDSFYISENLYRVYYISISDQYICAKVLLIDTDNAEDDDSEHDHNIIEKIFVIDRDTHKTDYIENIVGEVALAATVRGSHIYYISGESNDYNTLYDFSDGSRNTLCQIDQMGYVDNLFSGSDAIWYCDRGNVNKYIIEDDCEISFASITNYIPDAYRRYTINNIFFSSDESTVYVVHYASDILMKIYSDPNEDGYSKKDEGYTLKILVTENEAVTLNDKANLISEEFDINVEQIKYDADDGREKIGLKLLANDTDFDLFCIDATYIDYYAKNNAIYDLSQEAQIVRNFDNMFEGIKDLCSSNNILCGVPLSINQSQCLWKCNSELMKKLNFSVPLQKMTWTEFYELSKRLMQEANDLGINDFKVFSQNGMNIQFVEYMSNYLDYINQTTVDSRGEYSGFLNIYINMIDEGMISEKYEPSNSLFTIGGTFDYFTTDEYIFPEPLFSHESRYAVGVTILAVNPNSKHIEQAVEYLTAASSVSVQKKAVSTYLLKDREMYEYIDKSGNQQKLIDNTDGHSVLAFVISNSTRQYFNKDIFRQVQEYVSKMRNRSISVDEFSDMVYQKAKMIIEE